MAERLSHITFESLISSSLRRARQTTEYIARRCDKQPVFSDLFIERVKPSSVEGKTYTDEQALGTYNRWKKTLYTPGTHVEDGENFEDGVDRSRRAMAFLEDRPESSMVVVTHGYFLREVIATVLIGPELTGDNMRQFQSSAEMENTGLTVMHYTKPYEQDDYAWQLWTYNDHSHLS